MFLHDGAPVQYAVVARKYLNETYSFPQIERRGAITFIEKLQERITFLYNQITPGIKHNMQSLFERYHHYMEDIGHFQTDQLVAIFVNNFITCRSFFIKRFPLI